MKTLFSARVLITLALVVAFCGMVSLPLQARTHAVGTASPIQHIVWIQQENHTYDSYFATFPGGNGTLTGLVKNSGVVTTIPLRPAQLVPTNFNHSWGPARTAYDKGKMDAFNQADSNCSITANYACYQNGLDSSGNPIVPNYWALAQHYMLSDNTWSSLRGPSFPNHLYSMAGASGPLLNGTVDTAHSVVNNPKSSPWGCDSASTNLVQLQNGTYVYPCFSFGTLADEMSSQGVSWKYYAAQSGQKGYNWNVPDAFSQYRNNPTAWAAHDFPNTQVLTDAKNGTLPAFSWVAPTFGNSEHNGANVCNGENWSVSIIEAIMGNPTLWSNTAIVVTWDDWGGFYDHVAPQNIDGLGYGFRVPMLVISPYVIQGVNHTQFEFASILKFAEENFNLPSLGTRDVSAGDLSTAFDFTQTPLSALPLTQRTCPTVALPAAPPNIDD